MGVTGATKSHATFTAQVFHTDLVPTVWSIGHGTRTIEEFLSMLAEARIGALVDVRSAPGSRRHPHFGQSALASSLEEAGVRYVHLRGLGGRREAAPDSTHVALKVNAFRGYADHLASAEFAADYA